MKNILYSLFAAMLLIAACQPKTTPVAVDTAAEKDTIAKCLDAFYAAYTAKDAQTHLAGFTEDCLFCGTDPNEFWNKEDYSKIMTGIFADTSFKAPTFTIDKREIHMDKDGNSAIVVDQYFFKNISDKIPVRNVTHFRKTDNKWMCDFTSLSFIPNNADLGRIVKSMME
jgi:ketosteroid isomerase-like protein